MPDSYTILVLMCVIFTCAVVVAVLFDQGRIKAIEAADKRLRRVGPAITPTSRLTAAQDALVEDAITRAITGEVQK